MAVMGGQVVEVTIAQFWSTPGSMAVDVDVIFKGVTVAPDALHLSAHEAALRVDLRADVSPVSIRPELKLTAMQRSILPSNSVVFPLGARDLMPNGLKSYALNLTYKLDLPHTGDVVPRLPALNNVSRSHTAPFTELLCDFLLLWRPAAAL